MRGRCLALLLFLLLLAPAQPAMAQQPACSTWWITGFASSEYPGRMADGTPTSGQEWAAVAAPGWVPLGSTIWIEGLGELTVRDRGYLGAKQLDVLVGTRAEAFALTGYRTVCFGGAL